MILDTYQQEGARFLAARMQALLADDMGVGKTAQAIRACDQINAQRILVLVPASARVNWILEFAKWSPFERPAVALFDGGGRPNNALTVCSYSLVATNPRLLAALLAVKWDVLILDEAHYVKNRRANCTKAVYGRRCNGVGALAGAAARVWRLTGTPAPNAMDELWTHLHSAGVYPLGYYQFVDEFCTGYSSDFGFKITGVRNVPRLKALLEPFMLRRKKEDVVVLPPLEYETRVVQPSPVDAEAHFEEAHGEATMALLVIEVEERSKLLTELWAHSKAKSQMDPLEVLESLAPTMGTLRRWLALSKIPEYLKVLRPELESGAIDKLVVFTYHSTVLEGLRMALADFGVVTLFGETPAVKRQKRIEQFQNDPGTRIFIGQIRAAGEAITLTAACRVDIFEPSWSPAQNAQAIMRVHRIGQTRPVLVRFWGCDRSVDLEITRALLRKTRDLAQVFN